MYDIIKCAILERALKIKLHEKQLVIVRSLTCRMEQSAQYHLLSKVLNSYFFVLFVQSFNKM